MSTPLGPRTSRPHRGWYERGYLPHFDGGAVVQTITFRLADSLPRDVYASLVSSSDTNDERYKRLENLIDRGLGACILSDPKIAEIVAEALRYFDGERYRLLAWVIMPNHVHVMVEQIDGFSLRRVTHSWKSFTAKEINKLRNATGTVWAPDYYDRFVRNAEHYENAVSYIEWNPVKAALVRRPEDWIYSSAWHRK
jgi:REP element-mobilizing transposase RayT